MEIATESIEGVLLVDKPQGKTSFSLIRSLVRLIGVKKIGHAGTLDPFATGVMVMLIGRKFTRLSDIMLFEDKEYAAVAHLGTTTDTYDCDGKIVGRSKKVPTMEEVLECTSYFQGEIQQIPPMFSAKKVQGKKLYEYARQGLSIERQFATVRVDLRLVKYEYPRLHFVVQCSKGTYIRSIAHELGNMLGCGAYLEELRRLRSGIFSVDQCIDGNHLDEPGFDVVPHLRDADGLILQPAPRL